MGELRESSTGNKAASNDGASRGGAGRQAIASAPAENPPQAEHTASDVADELSEAMSSMTSTAAASDLGEQVTPGESVASGTEMTGTVVGLSDDDVFLEFGAKCQGVLLRSQFGKKEPIEVGRRVDVVVDRYDAESGLLIVYRKGAVQRATWNNLAVGMLVSGRVTGLIKGGLEVDLQGIRAFMPGSQASSVPMKDISVLLNERVCCEVIEVNRRSKNVLVSRRKQIEREKTEARDRLKAQLAVGQLRRGTVTNITSFGAFVDLGGLEGLAHIRDLRWSRVQKVSDVLSPGEEVEVKVLKIDAPRGRISLGLKQVLPDPWLDVSERYPVGTSLKVRIIRNTDFGAFAELEPGIEALIPLSEMSWTRVDKGSRIVAVGDIVDALVIRVDPKKRRLALSMKQATPDPWDGVLESFSEQSLVVCRVTRLVDFGVFVELTPGVEGLIHISELSDHRVRSCSDAVQVGQEVEARVLGIDKDNHRISLSLKQVNAPAQPPDESASASPEPRKAHKKRAKNLRGGLTSHFEW